MQPCPLGANFTHFPPTDPCTEPLTRCFEGNDLGRGMGYGLCSPVLCWKSGILTGVRWRNHQLEVSCLVGFFNLIVCHRWKAVAQGRKRLPIPKTWPVGSSSFPVWVQSHPITSSLEKCRITAAWLATSLCHLLWPLMDSQQTYVTIRSVKTSRGSYATKMWAYALCTINPTSEPGLLLKKTRRKMDEMFSSPTLVYQKGGLEEKFCSARGEGK